MRKKIIIILILVVAAAGLYLYAVPNVSALKKENPKKTSLMRFREAEWKAKKQKRTIYQVWVPLSRVSPYVIKATLIAEDDKFWSHEGFDFASIEKAVEKDIKARKFKAGGSTISQQLAKNLYLTPEKSAIRKIREAVITWKIERTLSKKRILELYLNVVEWGDGIYGIEAASRHYFGKSAMDLTPMEAARLAVVLPNPRRLVASGDQRYVAGRAGIIYDIMVRRGVVVPEFEEVEKETKEEATVQPVPDTAVDKAVGNEGVAPSGEPSAGPIPADEQKPMEGPVPQEPPRP